MPKAGPGAFGFPGTLKLNKTRAAMQVKPEECEKEKDQPPHLKVNSGNAVKQQLYALFTQDKTKETFANHVSSLVSSECASTDTFSSAAANQHGYETLEVITEDNVTKIMLNRPDKKNAISLKMYHEIIQALEQAGKDDSVITVLTGNGDYYCSGNDLNNSAQAAAEGIEKAARNSTDLFENFVKSFIDFPKPLIAVVNGPAVGAAVTVLGLCDIVYATERATFHTPFIQLGLCPEGCSSYIFPKIMGSAKANEMLLFCKKLTAKEACDQRLVTEVFPDSTFQKQVWARVHAYAQLPRESLTFSKQLIRGVEKEKLHAVNRQECELLIKRTTSDECMNAFLSFFQKKSKL